MAASEDHRAAKSPNAEGVPAMRAETIGPGDRIRESAPGGILPRTATNDEETGGGRGREPPKRPGVVRETHGSDAGGERTATGIHGKSTASHGASD
mmetsp:Transcript_28452/g.60985  ORF Transcript_28452/g.60985 Transcript_28452/m.60985 type:complete len:96 (-) Transcript_28452:622-909(-)